MMLLVPLCMTAKNWKQPNWQMAKQTVVHPYKGILLSNAKGQTTNTHKSIVFLYTSNKHVEIVF